MTQDRFTTTSPDALPPELTSAQWGKLAAGVGLALAGSGLVSLGTLVRLAAVTGGGLLAYRTWQEATDAGASPVPGDAAPATAAPRRTPTAAPSLDERPSLRDTLASGNDQNSPPGLTQVADLPAVDFRGA